MDETAESAPPQRPSRLAEIMASHDFLRDILVTTIGVLLALAIGEVADAWRQGRKAADAVVQMRQDAIQGQTTLIEREIIGVCVTRRLAQLRQVIDEGRSTGRLPTISDIGRPPSRPVVTTAWDMAVGQGLVTRMEPLNARRYRFLFESQRKIEHLQDGEAIQWNLLKLLENRPGPWPEALTADLYKAQVQAVDNDRMIRLIARQAVHRAFELRIPLVTFSGQPLKWDEGIKNVLSRPICKPLIVDGKPYRPPA